MLARRSRPRTRYRVRLAKPARWIAALVVVCAALLSSQSSSAGVARAVPLAELVRASDVVAIGTAVDSYSLWETVGARRRIVTYSRLRVDETVGKSGETELLVRTLGGHVGKIGQIVHGEPMVAIGQRAMLFVRHMGDGTSTIVGRTQGYFPLVADVQGTVRLAAGPSGSRLVGNVAGSALHDLVGQTPADATRLILSVMHP
jgi:hypothetical protein